MKTILAPLDLRESIANTLHDAVKDASPRMPSYGEMADRVLDKHPELHHAKHHDTLIGALSACDLFLRSLAVVARPVVDGDAVIELLSDVQTALGVIPTSAKEGS